MYNYLELSRGLFGTCVIIRWITILSLSIPSAIYFLHILSENDKIMKELFFKQLPRQRRALRVSSPETCLMVYSRRLVSDLNIISRFYFCDFSDVENES